MLENLFLSSNTLSQNFFDTVSEVFYQPLESLSNTLISLQYNSLTFFSFRIHEVSQGTIVNSEPNLAIQCEIQGHTYTFTREHFDQLSTREYREFLNQLKINSPVTFESIN